MTAKTTTKVKWTKADRARHKAIREEFQDCPTQDDLEASGDYALDRPVERPGTHMHAATGVTLDFLHNGVTMALAIGQHQQNMKYGRC